MSLCCCPPAKTHLIVKLDADLEKAHELFGTDGLNIGTDGNRYIGAVIGSEEFRHSFVKEKVDKWVRDVEILSEVAKVKWLKNLNDA